MNPSSDCNGADTAALPVQMPLLASDANRDCDDSRWPHWSDCRCCNARAGAVPQNRHNCVAWLWAAPTC